MINHSRLKNHFNLEQRNVTNRPQVPEVLDHADNFFLNYKTVLVSDTSSNLIYIKYPIHPLPIAHPLPSSSFSIEKLNTIK